MQSAQCLTSSGNDGAPSGIQQSPNKKPKLVDLCIPQRRLVEIDKKLINLMSDLKNCSAAPGGDSSDDDDFGDDSPRSRCIMKIACEIDALRREQTDITQFLAENRITVGPVDDGY